MARIQYGALLTSIKGSIGNLTFSGIGNNATARIKPANRKQRTPNQSMFLQLYREARIAWQSVSPSTKLYVKNFVTLFPKYFGNARNVDEAAMLHYCRVYIYCTLAGTTPNASVLFDNPPTSFEITSIQNYLGTFQVNFNRSALFNIPVVFLSKVRKDIAVQSQSKLTSWIKPALYSHSNFLDIGNGYITRYGTIPNIGEYIWAGCILVNPNTYHITDYSIQFTQIT
jgi:hypothetical protein